MVATDGVLEKPGDRALDERDVRALTQYLTVLDDVGRARGAAGLYLVVSQSGREYLVDAESGACECDDYRYRDERCKHLRRVAFATGRRAVPDELASEADPGLGEHVDGVVRYVATDGGVDARADGESDGDDSDDGTWTVRDVERGNERTFENRSEAEAAMDDLADLGLDVELVPPEDRTEASRPEVVDPREYDLGERTVGDDPLEWLPAAFVDEIDGTPAINRKGFEVLGHVYDVDVETDVQIGPADTDFVYCQVKATATTPDGRRCEALGSAHTGRGDDRTLLLELADTRARKRALSIATGVGVVAVEELQSELER